MNFECTSGTPAIKKLYVLLSEYYTVTMFAIVPDICVKAVCSDKYRRNL